MTVIVVYKIIRGIESIDSPFPRMGVSGSRVCKLKARRSKFKGDLEGCEESLLKVSNLAIEL